MARPNPYYSGPVTDHFDGVRFFNPGEPQTDRSLGDLLRWRRSAPNNPWPKRVHVHTTVPEARVEALTVTMVGHATLLIQIAGLNILTDPVWSDRASPLGFAGPKRIAAPGIALSRLCTSGGVPVAADWSITRTADRNTSASATPSD